MTKKPSREVGTENSYVSRAKNVIKKFESETKLSLSDSADFYEWLISHTTNKSDSNWRQIKASFVFYFSQIGFSEMARLLEDTDSSHTAKSSLIKHTSAQKKKSVSESEEIEISDALRSNEGTARHSYWDKPTLAFFKAGLLVGLRPCEWESATLITSPIEGSNQDLPILKVKNAKRTNGRSFGEYRYIGLNTLIENKELIWIRLALVYAQNPENGKKEQITFDALYNAISQRLYTITTSIYPRQPTRVTLYSCRHQFIANLKADGRSLINIACIVGHGNDVTASEHYGKKRVGRIGNNLPLANELDLKKINTFFVSRQQTSMPSLNK